MIYLLRHGLDDEKFIGGHSNVSLTKEGIKQVEICAKELESSKYKITKIMSSDIKRAKETAMIVNKRLNVPIYYTSMLRELDKGKLNGMLKTQAEIKYPKYLEPKDINLKYPEGESMLEFYKRLKKDMNSILANDNSLIITHRGVINMLYFLFNDIPLNMDKKQFGVDHASIHELDVNSKKIRKIRRQYEK